MIGVFVFDAGVLTREPVLLRGTGRLRILRPVHTAGRLSPNLYELGGTNTVTFGFGIVQGTGPYYIDVSGGTTGAPFTLPLQAQAVSAGSAVTGTRPA